uniref:Cytochrome c oxidase subunit 2 n=1 Tax=Liposcelis paeta TaxID=209927 RepID=A0A096X712_9NEOP|nr:cytochrome c oxidase subunit II [Liposcelis paeta]
MISTMNISDSSIYLVESISPLMEQMEEFHDHAMMILILIFSFLTVIFYNILKEKSLNLSFFSSEIMETTWTLIPILILALLAFPSLQVLFMMEELINPILTVKVLGNQWYWSYDYGDFEKNYDSFMKNSGIFRFLEVDHSLILPLLTQTRILISSNDVIHSWTVPSLGIKIDANPGRLNMGWLYSYRVGYYYGQCSEICGVNHSYMPIKIEFCNQKFFKNWINKYCHK